MLEIFSTEVLVELVWIVGKIQDQFLYCNFAYFGKRIKSRERVLISESGKRIKVRIPIAKRNSNTAIIEQNCQLTIIED